MHSLETNYHVFVTILNWRRFVVDGDPDNFLTHFQRATVFMALGRSKSAMPDLDRVLELKPEFFQVTISIPWIKIKLI